MKVLKEVPWTHKFTCDGCGSELEAEATDVYWSRMGTYDECETRHFVACPTCETLCYLRDLPPKVVRHAKQWSERGGVV